jgi:hypothetical protein
MKLTSRDFRSLRQAAHVADAQKELVELMKRQSENPLSGQKWETDDSLKVITAALALLFVITLASVIQAPNSETLADNGAQEQHVVSMD